jgi:hypothetical protein
MWKWAETRPQIVSCLKADRSTVCSAMSERIGFRFLRKDPSPVLSLCD